MTDEQINAAITEETGLWDHPYSSDTKRMYDFCTDLNAIHEAEMSHLDPPDDEDIECPECGAAAEQSCKYSVKCTECDWSFENLPDNPDCGFVEENNTL